MHLTRRLLAAAAVLGVLVAPAAAATPAGTGDEVRVEQVTVPVGAEPDGSEVTLDADVYHPAEGRDRSHEAVLLAHGFGGSKDDLTDRAHALAEQGYLVVGYSARGFGDSGGAVHLNDPDYEVADARVLVDLIAEQPQVRRDGPRDPRVAVAGGSYGGALALMAAGADQRIDSVVAAITWHDLADAFFPQSATELEEPGPFTALWASNFLMGSFRGGGNADPACAGFAARECELFVTAAETGAAHPDLLEMLSRHSPAPTLADIEAPVHLVQGMSDTLFGIEQAEATARALQEAGVPVAVSWFNGGHDGPTQPTDSGSAGSGDGGGPPTEDGQIEASDQERQQTADLMTWLEGTLRVEEPVTQATLPVAAFRYALPPSPSDEADDEQVVGASSRPPADGTADTEALALSPVASTSLVNPPGGVPRATTVLPGQGGLGPLTSTVSTYPLSALPGQSVAFDTDPLEEDLLVVGRPRIDLELTSTGSSSTLFLSLWQVRNGSPVLPRRLVAPLQVDLDPGAPTRVTVDLPGGTWEMPAGSTWRVLVTATDAAYAGPDEVRVDRVEAAGPLVLPTGGGAPVSTGSVWDAETLGVAGALALLLLLVGATALRQRSVRRPPREDLADVPLVVDGLVKEYADGHRAVDDVSWRADRGQVVGLLGPNGAGKTTTLRMVMGLIRPDAGSVHVLGVPVTAGAVVLGRVGALVEGPGFLPHLSGRANLLSYWAATGNPAEESRLAEVLEIAALGDAIDRPVRAYSHGMRQRLGIAQAMLGMPEVLILDEPTNGLDPPQIAAMRPILARYAAGGRTVVISSHLLAEVELTCTHVVVMHAGRVLVTGSVDELGVAGGRTLESVFLTTIAAAGEGSHLNRVRSR
ncbi:alpha/beta fold hydrolase [Janibacter cremeus]|uniref:alpha/beta fold hydrolase n=1 Tax=Janibacter cremeus TaxID=1285192 RepID=UPI0023F97347|nr:alpha/beta fold hydrolase [Janibacter cremeus]WEV77240.1 alpha/beta fold hydrolase [Janibacter cremeus]